MPHSIKVGGWLVVTDYADASVQTFDTYEEACEELEKRKVENENHKIRHGEYNNGLDSYLAPIVHHYEAKSNHIFGERIKPDTKPTE